LGGEGRAARASATDALGQGDPEKAELSRMTSRVNGFMTYSSAPASRAEVSRGNSFSVVTIISRRPA